MRGQEAQSRRNEAEWRCKHRHPSLIIIASVGPAVQDVYMPMEISTRNQNRTATRRKGTTSMANTTFRGESVDESHGRYLCLRGGGGVHRKT